jgi:hypothetical protein
MIKRHQSITENRNVFLQKKVLWGTLKLSHWKMWIVRRAK